MRRRTRIGFGPAPVATVLCLALLWVGLASAGPSTTAHVWNPPSSIPESAVGQDVVFDDEPQVEARLLTSSGTAAEPAQIGVHFTLAEGWHLYWRNPGDTGLAPKLEVESPGYEAGPIAWPAPEIFEESDGLFTTFGYSGQVLLSMPLTPTTAAPSSSSASKASANTTIVRVDANVLVCRTECVPAKFSLSSPLRASLPPRDQSSVNALFAEARTLAPISNEIAQIKASVRWTENDPAIDESATLALSVSACPESQTHCEGEVGGHSALPFLPLEGLPFEFANQRFVPDANSTGRGVIHIDATRLDHGDGRLRGLVAIKDAQNRLIHVAIDVPIEGRASQQATSPAGSFAGWLQIIMLALVGGFILNGMPCVLPVLAIKVVAIAGLAEESPAEVRKQGLAYTAGVLGSMAILAALVISLRQAGHSVGWGFQFQEPLFVAAISGVLVAFALNLFGVYEIDFGQGRLAHLGQTGSATRRSLFEGLLAVVLATPCTAPFLGTAVGFAFAASDASILTIFLAIGLGLALPFLVVSFVPALARFIPRSGPWMMKLRATLGFSLLATCVWLLWIVGHSGGTNAIAGVMSMLLVLAFLLWGFGQAQPLRSPWMARVGALGIAGIALAGFNGVDFSTSSAASSSADSTGVVVDAAEAEWLAYSDDGVTAQLAEGRPVFVVFTADWCITCKVNETTVLDRPRIRAAFSTHGVALFKADWTRRDERIRSTLARFGRAGVPLYLVYSPDRPNDPEVLSELLSAAEVEAALARSLPVARS